MSCYATKIYATGFVHISAPLNIQQSVYLLPDGVSAKTAIANLIMEYLSTMRQNGEMAAISSMMDIAKNATFASKSIAHLKHGKPHHNWIENPYLNCSYTERRRFVNDVVENFRKMELLGLEEIHPIVCL